MNINSSKKTLKKGLTTILLFENAGTLKYYNNKMSKQIFIDQHMLVTLYKLNEFKKHNDLAKKVYFWTVKNMQSPEAIFTTK